MFPLLPLFGGDVHLTPPGLHFFLSSTPGLHPGLFTFCPSGATPRQTSGVSFCSGPSGQSRGNRRRLILPLRAISRQPAETHSAPPGQSAASGVLLSWL